MASVPISLQISRTLPEDVFVRAYVDGKLISSKTIEFKHLVQKTFTFTIDTRDYSSGTHTIEVRATIDYTTDTSRRTFTLGPEFDVVHCLDIMDIRTDQLKPGEQVKVEIEVSNCGSLRESNIRVKLEAFSRIYYGNIASIFPGKSEEVELLLSVPEDATGTNTFYVRVEFLHFRF